MVICQFLWKFVNFPSSIPKQIKSITFRPLTAIRNYFAGTRIGIKIIRVFFIYFSLQNFRPKCCWNYLKGHFLVSEIPFMQGMRGMLKIINRLLMFIRHSLQANAICIRDMCASFRWIFDSIKDYPFFAILIFCFCYCSSAGERSLDYHVGYKISPHTRILSMDRNNPAL